MPSSRSRSDRNVKRKTQTTVTGAHVPSFVSSMWDMVNQPDFQHIIHWSDAGDSFIVEDEAGLSEQVLPRYFTHTNVASFGRQVSC